MVSEFEHLKFHKIIVDEAYFGGGGNTTQASKNNKSNRVNHSNYLNGSLNNILMQRKEYSAERVKNGLAPLPTEMPLLLKLDEESYPIGDLYKYGLEVVAEDEEGYVVVATDEAGLNKFLELLETFKSTTEAGRSISGSGKIAEIHEIDNTDLPKKRLTEFLYGLWPFESEKEYIVDISIESKGLEPFHISDIRKRETEQDYFERTEIEKRNKYAEWGKFIDAREEYFLNFIKSYKGQYEILEECVMDIYNNEEPPECFDVRIKANGKILNDLVLNFPYLFEISEPDEICCEIQAANLTAEELEFNILQPDNDSPTVCIIDSGIQEGHKYIEPAILTEASKSFIDDESVADEYKPNGHGTRVTGRVLYPYGFNVQDNYKLPCWICNARILDKNNCLPENKHPANLVKKVVTENIDKVKIFNQSINALSPCRKKHMSSWASEIDLLSYKNDILFIQSAGNIHSETSSVIPYNGIKNYLALGKTYPEYLYEEISSRIANPAQSMFALTVGSLANGEFFNEITGEKSMESIDMPSSFSRSGFGMWGCIKPDVVEYGGGYVITQDNNLKIKEATSIELLRTSPPGPAYSKDDVGTSYSTPKVSYIASEIQKMFPKQSALFYRTLIAHSAQWTNWANSLPDNQKLNALKTIGYGVPNLEDALRNNDYKVTFVTEHNTEIIPKQAHIYYIPIPETLRSAGEDKDIKVTVTLAYTAKPRRTRIKKRGYLSSWLEWDTCKPDEELDKFQARIFVTDEESGDYKNEPWFLATRDTDGKIKGISRNESTLQKDWRTIKSHQLPERFGIAVRSHKGWDNDPFSKAYYSLVVSFEAINNDLKVYNEIKAQLQTEIEADTEIRNEIEL